jgi:hypothetical protein
MSHDLDACALTGADGEAIFDAVDMAETAISILLDEIRAAQTGAIIDKTEALGAVLTINSAFRTVVKTLEDAKNREVAQ